MSGDSMTSISKVVPRGGCRRPSSQQLLVRVDEWGQHDQHFKSGPMRARAADLTVISRTL